MTTDLDRWRIRAWLPTGLGVIISVALGAFFYQRTDLNAAFATFAGLLGLTVTLQLEMLLQARRIADDELRRQRLLSRIDVTPWLPDLLDRSLAALASIEDNYRGAMAVELARKEFETGVRTLEDLQRGHYQTPVADDDWLIQRFTERITRSLSATSLDPDDLDWWGTASGQHYLKLHQYAHDRGVRTERVFIYQTWTQRHTDVADWQHRCGVRVLRIRADKLPAHLRIGIIIWDETAAFELAFNSDGTVIANRYTFAAQDLSRLIANYKVIESLAESWPVPADAAVGRSPAS